MLELLIVIGRALALTLRDHQELVLENLALRQQLAAVKRTRKRSPLQPRDRLFWIALVRWQHRKATLKPAPGGRASSPLLPSSVPKEMSARHRPTHTGDGMEGGRLTAQRPRVLFDQGGEAFRRSFPELARRVPWDRFYVCPICLLAFNEEALAAGFLTIEHVPPESVGGKRLTLTCKECNNEGGSDADSHMRLEANVYDFAAGTLQQIKAVLRTESGRVPIPAHRSW